MTRVTATVDEQGRLTLPEEIAQLLQAGQQLVIDLPLEENPFTRFIGTLPPLDVDSVAYYRQERGHEE
ncbi:hypothetical protein F8S09_15095 [Deinococcus sp. SDU3-2]|uniref:Uncharacterized protein n=1 Tax=Deinococcus terrestris TaxID=2651870 RepID=A0A7X1NZ16_9DEIO|nr:hypothetical protein [Deinococcus terrestris]MPY67986.1 hypothetical protein [Deinococcus terrestris]